MTERLRRGRHRYYEDVSDAQAFFRRYHLIQYYQISLRIHCITERAESGHSARVQEGRLKRCSTRRFVRTRYIIFGIDITSQQNEHRTEHEHEHDQTQNQRALAPGRHERTNERTTKAKQTKRTITARE